MNRPDPERFRRALEYMDNCLYRKHGCPFSADVRRRKNGTENETRVETHPVRQERHAMARGHGVSAGPA
jgi:hypothetical protein